jgi:hypothetical protein
MSENYNSIQCRLSVKIVFFMLVLYRECLFSDDVYSGRTLILTTSAMKQCMDIGARPDVSGIFLLLLTFILTLADGLCHAWFIYPILCCCWCLEIGTSSTDWAQLSRFHLQTDRQTESRLQTVVVLNKKMMMDNVTETQ